MELPAFLPDLAGLRLDDDTATAERMTLWVAATSRTARCPACQSGSARIHSCYVRMVVDVSWGGGRLPAARLSACRA